MLRCLYLPLGLTLPLLLLRRVFETHHLHPWLPWSCLLSASSETLLHTPNRNSLNFGISAPLPTVFSYHGGLPRASHTQRLQDSFLMFSQLYSAALLIHGPPQALRCGLSSLVNQTGTQRLHDQELLSLPMPLASLFLLSLSHFCLFS